MQQYTSAYEGLYPMRTDGRGDKPDQREWGFPALYKVKNEPVWVLVTEANVTRANCASRLSNREDENIYTVAMPEKEVSAVLPWKSAWRVVMVGALSDIVESTLVADVSEPSKVDTTEWIRPGTVPLRRPTSIRRVGREICLSSHSLPWPASEGFQSWAYAAVFN